MKAARLLAEQKGQPFVGPCRRDFEDLGAYNISRHKRIAIHPALKIPQRRIVRDNAAAQIGLQAADQQEYAIVKAALNSL
jgi:hypothetical protein